MRATDNFGYKFVIVVTALLLVQKNEMKVCIAVDMAAQKW
jgi:hypothetical protein